MGLVKAYVHCSCFDWRLFLPSFVLVAMDTITSKEIRTSHTIDCNVHARDIRVRDIRVRGVRVRGVCILLIFNLISGRLVSARVPPNS